MDERLPICSRCNRHYAPIDRRGVPYGDPEHDCIGGPIFILRKSRSVICPRCANDLPEHARWEIPNDLQLCDEPNVKGRCDACGVEGLVYNGLWAPVVCKACVDGWREANSVQ